MSAPWIRVNSRLLDDLQVRRLAIVLGIPGGVRCSVAATAGLLVALWGQLVEGAPSGDVSAVDDDQIETWARWWGKAGVFAAAWRTEFVQDGQVQDWEAYNGAALRRRADDAERKRRERGGAPSSPRPTDSPKPPKRTSSVNGDGHGDGEHPAAAVVADHPTTPPAPPADSVVQTAAGSVTFPKEAQALLRKFYGGNAEKAADAARQLLGALGSGAKLDRESVVRAYDHEHLRWACRMVLAEPPNKPELAARFVLLKLRDTYLEVKARHEKAARATESEEREDLVAEAQRYVDGIGGLWDLIETEVDGLLEPAQRGKPSPSRNILLEAAVLDAFERKRTLGDGSAPAARRAPGASTAGPPAPPTQPWQPAQLDSGKRAEIPADLLEE